MSSKTTEKDPGDKLRISISLVKDIDVSSITPENIDEILTQFRHGLLDTALGIKGMPLMPKVEPPRPTATKPTIIGIQRKEDGNGEVKESVIVGEEPGEAASDGKPQPATSKEPTKPPAKETPASVETIRKQYELKNTENTNKILTTLLEADGATLSLKELTSKTGLPYGSVASWLHQTGSKVPAIAKVEGEGYRLNTKMLKTK